MVWGALISGLGNLGTSLFIHDEKARAAANLAIAGVAAGCCDPTGLGVAGAVVTIAKEATTLGMAAGEVEDQSVQAGVNTGFGLVANAISLNPVGVAQTAGGAAVGAAAGAMAEAEGVEGFDVASGMSMGANLATGGIDEVGAKVGGAAAGAAAGAVAGEAADEDGAAMVTLGMNMGASAGAGINGLTTTKQDLVEQEELHTSFLEEGRPAEEIAKSITDEQVQKARVDAAIRLGAQAVGLGSSVVVHAASEEEGDADLVDSLRAGQSIGSALGTVGTMDTSSKASVSAAAMEAAAAAATVANEVENKAELRQLRRAAEAGDRSSAIAYEALAEDVGHIDGALGAVDGAASGVRGLARAGAPAPTPEKKAEPELGVPMRVSTLIDVHLA
jgi:hypothetical protein